MACLCKLAVPAAAILLVFTANATPAPRDDASGSLDLVDPNVFRVCADPRNLPFSDQKGEGFENKLAELFAAKLGKPVSYTWYPNSLGFIRNTLSAYRCDVIMGYPEGMDIAEATEPYYTSTYALIFKPGGGLDGAESLSDPRLKDKRIGIVAGTPPSDILVANGLMARAKPYPLMVDTRVDSSAEAMVKDIESGEIDAGVLWGPLAGYYALHANPKLTVVPLLKEKRPGMSYSIALGVRHQDKDFKKILNRLIEDNRQEIKALLLAYGVPLLDQPRP